MRLFEARRLLTFSALRMGAYSRWTLIQGWALIRINTVKIFNKQLLCLSFLSYCSFTKHDRETTASLLRNTSANFIEFLVSLLSGSVLMGASRYEAKEGCFQIVMFNDVH